MMFLHLWRSRPVLLLFFNDTATTEIYTLSLHDALPIAGDLAVQESARIALGLRKRPDAKALAKMAEAWRPWRGVAAHLLWAYYHVVKKRDVVPVQPNGGPNEAAGTNTTKRKKQNG